MKKTIISIVLLVLMAGLFAGCSQENTVVDGGSSGVQVDEPVIADAQDDLDELDQLTADLDALEGIDADLANI
ncbi:hypothetical protein GOV04_00160 [Candidatus Woesearchaeota archaeon]|nr:hypothetical protein [Candidatus Woesearchaeota archaeon]